MENPLFKIAFLNDQNTLDKSFTFLVVTCLDYHFLQSDLVGRPKLCEISVSEISVQVCNLKNWTPVTFK